MNTTLVSVPFAFVLMMVVALGFAEGNMKMKTPQEPARRITPKQAVERAVQSAAEPLGLTLSALTPPLPGTWPPSGDRSVVYLAYVRVPLPTSTERYQVYSPFLRIDLIIEEAAPPPSVKRLKSHQLQISEGSNVVDPSAEAMERATRILFDAVWQGAASKEPTGALAADLRAPYRTWIRAHTAVAAALRPKFPAFFKWLESDR